MRFAVCSIAFVLCAFGATLEKLSLDQMAQQSTMIVRGQVTGCNGEARGSLIYTRCGVAVSETWKGDALDEGGFPRAGWLGQRSHSDIYRHTKIRP